MYTYTSWNDKITFGKYIGLTIRSIFQTQPTYLKWLVGNGIAIIPDEVIDKVTEATTKPSVKEKFINKRILVKQASRLTFRG
jgi:hypothetical protein